MTLDLSIISVSISFATAILALWYASVLIREHRQFGPFMPIFLWGVFTCMRSALLHYSLSLTFLWYALDFGFALVYALMLFVIVRLFSTDL